MNVAREYAGPILPSRSQDESVSQTWRGESSGRCVPSEFGRCLGSGYREFWIDGDDPGGFADRPELLLYEGLSESISQAAMSDLGENDGRGEAPVGCVDQALGFDAEVGSADQLDPSERINREIQSDLPR
ncbi:MAG: hypothetical protein WAN74_01515 [Thermoplasmata archaeon]